MTPSLDTPVALAPLSRDGLGERFLLDDHPRGTAPLVLLRVAPVYGAHPGFEPALRQRVAEVSRFFHPSFAHVQRVERAGQTLVVVSEASCGVRLSDLLRASEQKRLAIEANAALHAVQQLLRAVGAMHAHGPELAHGAIAPDRLLLAAPGSMVVTDHVFGPALERLELGPDRLWREARIVVPPGVPGFSARSDVMQIGLVALSLIIGRELRTEEYPARFIELLKTATEADANGQRLPLAPIVKVWLARALQIADGFATIAEAGQALDHLFAGASRYVTSLISLQTLLERFEAAQPSPLSPQSSDKWPQSPAGEQTQSSVLSPYSSIKPPQPPGVERGAAQVWDWATKRPPVGTPQPTVPYPQPPAATPRAPVATPHSSIQSPQPSVQRPQSSIASPPSPVVDQGTVDVWEAEPDHHQASVLSRRVPVAEQPRAGSRQPEDRPPVASHHFAAPAGARTGESEGAAPDLASSSLDQAASVGLRVPELWNPLAAQAAIPPAPPPPVEKERMRAPRPAVGAAIAAAILALVVPYGWRAARGRQTAPPIGYVALDSRPSGLELFVDGQPMGKAPIAAFELPAGWHLLEVRGGTKPVSMPLELAAGEHVTRVIEVPDSAPTTGQIDVRSVPPGAAVTVDEIDRGVTPLVVSALAPGDHVVAVRGAGGVVQQHVRVESGGTAAVVVPLPVADPSAPGWLAFRSPVEIQLFELDRFLGTTASDRIVIAAGRHEITLKNEALGYEETRIVSVTAGKTLSDQLRLPTGTLQINAVPWAEVQVDGEAKGETPIGNLQLTIGDHDVTFRHPQFGERHQVATVRVGGQTRVSIDWRQ